MTAAEFLLWFCVGFIIGSFGVAAFLIWRDRP